MKLSRLFTGLVLLTSAFLVGCSSGPSVKLDLYASANSSLDEMGRPLSTVVRVYQLSGTRAFESSSFEELWQADIKVLGREIVSRQEFFVVPNSSRVISVNKQKDARYIAVVALFRNPISGRWRAYRPLHNGYIRGRFGEGVRITLRNNELLMD